MTIATPYRGSATATTSEFSMVNGSTSLASATGTGIYELTMDWSNLDDATVIEVKIKEQGLVTAGQAVLHYTTLANAQATEPLQKFPSVTLGEGIDFTMKLVTGSATLVGYSIRKIT